MKNAFRVAVRGFSAFERATFESFFRLSARRTPTYLYCDDLRDSEFVIADADNRQVMQAVNEAGLRGQTLSIGAEHADGVAARLPRPINLMAVVKALDQLPKSEPAPATSQPVRPAPAAASPAGRPAPESIPRPTPATTEPVPSVDPPHPFSMAFEAVPDPDRAEPPTPVRTAPQAPPVAPPVAASVAAPVAAPAPQTQAEPTRFDPLQTRPYGPHELQPQAGAAMDHILVVDDSDIALRFMAGLLERYGFQVHLARSGTEAIARTDERHFAFVFMDVNMPGLDGFQTCKAIKRRIWPAGQEAPTVVMLTSRDTPVDKLRGTMAGCDAYLTKPLSEPALLKVVGDREVRQHAYRDTARATQHG